MALILPDPHLLPASLSEADLGQLILGYIVGEQ